MPQQDTESARAVNPKLAKELLLATFLTHRTPALWGPPATAKSAVLTEIANDMGVAMLDMRLAQFAPEDLRGIPFPQEKNGFVGMSWNPPETMPRDLDLNYVEDIEAEDHTIVRFYNPRSDVNDIFYCTKPEITVFPFDRSHVATIADVLENGTGRLYDRFSLKLHDSEGNPVSGKIRVVVKGKVKVLWALEEFNSADMNVQAACYELTLDRRLGTYKVPDGVMMALTGNLDTDLGVTYRLGRPIANRLVHFVMRMEYADWVDWASGKIHPLILAYLEKFPEHLNDPVAKADQRAFNTARTWHILSDLLIANPEARDEVMLNLALGTVGFTQATILMKYKDIAAGESVSVEDILSGKVSKVTFDRKDRAYLGTFYRNALCSKLRDEYNDIRADPNFQKRGGVAKKLAVYYKRCNNYLAYLNASLPLESMIAGVTLAVNRYRIDLNPDAVPLFAEFCEQHGQYLVPPGDQSNVG